LCPPNSLSASEAAALRLTFVKHLAQVNDKGEVVRLTARWEDLPAAAKPLLEKFVNERLLIRSENKEEGKGGQRWVSVEVAHEAMFRCGNDLKGWLRTSADILRWRRDVRRDQAHDPKWTGLRPAQLAVARDWPKRRRDELTADEVDWIRRGIRWERIRRGIVAAVVLVVGLSAVIAGWQWYEAANATRAAQHARNLAVTEKNAAKKAAALADLDLSSLYLARIKPDWPEALAHLARGLRTDPANALLRQSSVLLLTTNVWYFPSTEPLHDNNWVPAANFSPDGTRIVTASGNTARIWDVAVDLEASLPEWFPLLLETLGGKRFNEDGSLVDKKQDLFEVREQSLALKGDDFWSRFGRWFVRQGPERTISPNSSVTVREWEENQQKVAGH
jgi:hypothetical protein